MTSLATILPTSANTKPELTRPRVPEALLNRLTNKDSPPKSIDNKPEIKPTEAQTPKENKTFLAESDEKVKQTGRSTNLAGPSAIAVQVSEAKVPEQPAKNLTPPEDNRKFSDSSLGPKLENQLSDEEIIIVKELRERDQEVRRHENAHAASGGGHTGAIEYEYTRGPDGQRYAIAGKVSIDTSAADTPSATIEKMRVVQAAALAPASPSGADRAVAAKAAATLRQAEAELANQKAEEKEAARDVEQDNESKSDVNVSNESDTKGPTEGNYVLAQNITAPQSLQYSTAQQSPEADQDTNNLVPQSISIDLIA